MTKQPRASYTRESREESIQMALGMATMPSGSWKRPGAYPFHYRHCNDVKQDNLVGELRSKFSSDVWNVGLRGDYRIETNYVGITPSIGLEYANCRQKSYNTELFDQAVVSNDSANMDTWHIPVGVTFDKQFELESGGVITPEFRVHYIPTLGDRNLKTTTWLPGSSTTSSMTGADVDRHTGEVGLGLQFAKSNLSLNANYDFQFSQHRQAHGLTAQVRYTF